MPVYRPSISREKFLRESTDGFIMPVYAEIPYISPEQLYPLFSGNNSFLFESVTGPENIARYSFLGFDPFIIFRAKDGITEISFAGNNKSVFTENPLLILQGILRGYAQKHQQELPPFQGGAAGVFSYDFIHYLEDIPKTTVDDLHVPDSHIFITDRLIAFDHKNKKAWAIICPGLRETNAGLSASYDEAEGHLADICKKIYGFSPDNKIFAIKKVRQKIEIDYEMKKEDYITIVKKIKTYISAGDIFQANISQRLRAYIDDLNPWSLYMALRGINPAPFAGFINFDDYYIVSSSPERLVRVNNGLIDTRPIAGTRPRGRTEKEDSGLRTELLLNEKERAEHIMLIDLERNDLGKVSAYGSIEVDELMITENYSHVMHIVSNIKGVVERNKTCADILRAVFPGGTITGVPKIRCMEIIDELEPVRRGSYTGSMGYIAFNGNMDLNIIIRTFVIKDGYAYVQAGAGIVADSDPESEYHETLKKAEAMIRTLEIV